MTTDPIADMLARIRNAQLARHERVEMPLSKLKLQHRRDPQARGLHRRRALRDEGTPASSRSCSSTASGRSGAIAGMRRVSRPGRRVYVGHNELPKVMNGLGIAILSTSRGVMTDKDARASSVGGESLRGLVMTPQAQPTGSVSRASASARSRCPRASRSRSTATTVTVKGPKGTLARKLPPMRQRQDRRTTTLIVGLEPDAGRDGAQFQGLTRALLANMVEGRDQGYAIALDLTASATAPSSRASELTLALGLSHPVKYPLPAGVNAKVEILDEGGTKRPRLHLDSRDKELLGQTAARIRSFRPPEPYKGKGVRYMGEKIRMKAGKAGQGRREGQVARADRA